MQGCGFANLPSLLYHPLLVCSKFTFFFFSQVLTRIATEPVGGGWTRWRWCLRRDGWTQWGWCLRRDGWTQWGWCLMGYGCTRCRLSQSAICYGRNKVSMKYHNDDCIVIDLPSYPCAWTITLPSSQTVLSSSLTASSLSLSVSNNKGIRLCCVYYY